MTPLEILELARQLHEAGRREEAIVEYRRALALAPAIAEGHYNLGLALHQAGHVIEAAACYQHAIRLKSDYAEAHNNLAVALTQLNHPDEAISTFQRAVELLPSYGPAWLNLANALIERGRINESIDAFKTGICLQPENVVARNRLGNILQNAGRFEEAMKEFRQVIQIQPNEAGYFFNLGNALVGARRNDEAIAMFAKALQLKPDFPDAWNNLGNIYRDRGLTDNALAVYQRGLALAPDDVMILNNLGNALMDARQSDEAIACFRRALAMKPDMGELHNNLGELLRARGSIDEALASFRRAVELQPMPEYHSNVLMTLNYRERDPQSVFSEHRQWAAIYAAPLVRASPHRNDRSPDRPLRIGYVSPDFRQHSVGAFFLPLLASRDRAAFHVTCYSASARRDSVTEQIISNVDNWVELYGETDQRATARIESDQIDILIDLAGHTANNRLLVFARKPAPVQATYLGYPNTTGMDAMDWRITDETADPAGTEAFHTEKLMRLPVTAWCYHPLAGSPPVEIARRTEVVFGSFNDMSKINPALLRTWSRILKEVAGSRLVLKNRGTGAASVQKELRQQMAEYGIAEERLEIIPPLRSPEDHLRAYHGIDIALDAFPYHGTTTTCEALWMGVPVVGRSGRLHVSRVGVSLLGSVGLSELVAADEEEYVRIAVALANDRGRIEELRRALRDRMKCSPLMDSAAFVRQLEAAYRRMWLNWVNQ